MLFSCLPASTSYGYEIVCCHTGFRTENLPSGYKLMISDMEVGGEGETLSSRCGFVRSSVECFPFYYCSPLWLGLYCYYTFLKFHWNSIKVIYVVSCRPTMCFLTYLCRLFIP